MKELDLLVENYFTESFETSDLLRLVEQVMDEQPNQSLAACKKAKPTEAGKRFEWVVVYKARERAGAAPLSDDEYMCAANSWAQQPYPNACQFLGLKDHPSCKKPDSEVTLGELADKAIDKALQSGAITKEDLAKANMQTMGKQYPFNDENRKPIEIKTDIVFGKKTISVKLSGDVQGQSSEAFSTVQQMNNVFTEVFKNWEAINKKIDEKVLERVKKDLEKIFAKMKRIGKQTRLTPSRVKTLVDKDLKSSDPKKRAKAKKRYDALLAAEIIDKQGEILIQALNQATWEENHRQYMNDAIKKLIDPKKYPDLRRALTDEILTGRRMFAHAPGAASQYILSPEHFFVLAPGVEGYNDSIDIFSRAMDVDVRPKSGREIEGTTIGVKPAYRFDLKRKAVEEAIEYFAALKKANEAEQAALGLK